MLSILPGSYNSESAVGTPWVSVDDSVVGTWAKAYVSLHRGNSDCSLSLQGDTHQLPFLAAPGSGPRLYSFTPALTIHLVEVVVEMGCASSTPTLHQQVPIGCGVAGHECHLVVIV